MILLRQPLVRLSKYSLLVCGVVLAGVGVEAKIEILDLHQAQSNGTPDSLFSELNAKDIGLGDFENNYSSPSVWTNRWREYLLGTIGVGIAIGDIDGDRLPDLFLASKDEKSRLYRNLGDLKFEEISDESGFVDAASPASGCTFVDVDNDHDLDLYLCYVGGKNELWINDGRGRFSEEAAAWGIDIHDGCTMASFADYDRDGDLDFYLQNNLLSDGPDYRKLEDRLFENLGNRFREVTSSAGISGAGHGHSALWWDYNEDGWPDIYVANDFEDLDKLYRNNRDGTFTDILSQVFPQVPYYSMGADFGDVNNDGHSDYWVADMAATTRAHHLRTVGNHDHVYKNTPESETHQSLKNALLLKIGSEHFADTAFLSGLSATDWTWAARLVDLNNDGWLDAYATNGMLRSFHDGDLCAKQGAFSSADWMTVVFRNERVMKERNLVYENMGGLNFQDRSQLWGLDKLGVSFGVSFADLDLDGDMDLLTNNFQEEPSVFRNNDTDGNRITIGLKGNQSNAFGIGAKVTVVSGGLVQVKELALMRGYMSSDQPILHFGFSTYATIDQLTVDWPSGLTQVFTGLPVNRHFEIEEDGSSLVSENKEKRPLFIKSRIQLPDTANRKEAYFSDFRKQELLPFALSRLGGRAVVGDLNSDGELDVILSGASGQELQVLVNSGNELLEAVPVFDFEEDFGSEDMELRLIDWDADGDLDLLVASGGVELEVGDAFYGDRLYLNEGDGTFYRDWGFALSDIHQSSSSISVADFDNDGDEDIFAGGQSVPGAYPYAYPSILWINQDGRYERADSSIISELDTVGIVSSAEWVDIDDDHDLDLLVLSVWESPKLYRNAAGQLKLESLPLTDGEIKGLWSGSSFGDFNDDGQIDILVGNWGSNSEYRASEREPLRLWFSDKAKGNVDLIETYIQGDVEWTREAKWRLEKSFPRQIKRIRTYDQFATMPFSEMFPGIEDAGYRYKEVTELRTGILWQSSDGSFTFEALPYFAQSGRVTGLLVRDVNNDGRPDILTSLELPSPEPWSGRFEKGHLGLFLNRGNKIFDTVLPWDSGLIVDGSPRGLAWGDLGGSKSAELIVMLSEGMPQVFSLSDADQ